MLTKLSRRIFQTVAYTDQFEYPLTSFQVWQRLVAEKAPFSKVKVSLNELQQEKYLGFKDGKYFLFNRSNTIEQRLLKEKRASKVLEVHKELLRVIKYLPWICGVAITGSVSMHVAEKNDDLDVMIITKPNTLWLSRLLLTMIASFLGRRRFWWEDRNWLQPDKSIRTKWCLNLWLTEDDMTVPLVKQSIYTAYEVCQATFIYDRYHIEKSFLEANSWVSDYLPHFYHFRKRSFFSEEDANVKIISILESIAKPIVFIADYVLFIFQWLYMLSHMTIEKVGRSVAYFHPRPTNTFIIDGWKKSISDTMLLRKKTHTKNKVLLVDSANSSESLVMKKKVTISKKKNESSDSKPSSSVSESVFKLSEEVVESLEKARKRKQKIVLVTGVFDMIHIAHRQFLVQARIAGDFLIVGLESDKRVTELKGAGRPINNQKRRSSQMENLGVADAIFVLPENFSNEEDHLAVISVIKPDVLAVSSHTPHLDKKQKLLKKVGGKVKIVMQQDTSVSTTKLLKQMGKE